jgi:drug/metabolite transporter (DMT)-like permease
MFYLSLCSIIWGFSYGLIKGNLTGISPDLVAWLRMIVPFICFLPFLRAKSLSLKEVLSFFLIGAVQYGIMYLLVIRSYQYLAAYQILLFCACTPIYVTLIDDAFSRKFRPFYLLVAALAFLGSAFIYYQNFSWNSVFKGFLLVQASDLCFAFGQVAYRRFKSKNPAYQDESIYALLFLGGTVITALSTVVYGGWGSLVSLSLKQTWIIFYLGIVSSGLCFFWWNKAAHTVSSGTLAVFNNMKIPLGVCISILFFGEKANLLMVTLSLFFIGSALAFSEWYTIKNTVFLKKKAATS